MIKQVIVVEGKDDTVAVKRAVEADTIETGGSAIDRGSLERIRLAAERRGVIILTDPDHAGERIRKIVAAAVPGCQHAFITREEGEARGDIGVENASPEAIRRALAHVRTEYAGAEPEVAWSDLIDAGLIHHPRAAERRRIAGERLGIGYCNGKQFYKRCAMFAITLPQFHDALSGIDEQE